MKIRAWTLRIDKPAFCVVDIVLREYCPDVYMIKIDFYNKTKRKININFQRIAKKAFESLVSRKIISAGKDYFIELNCVGEKTIRSLNKRFRKKDAATDVISLSYFNSAVDSGFAGEIFICPLVAQRQAPKSNSDFWDEIRFLFVHGLLHVFGYDHKNAAQLAAMNRLTEEILR